MKIQYASDLHLEFPLNKKFILENPIIPTGEILILAGDIIPFTQLNEQNYFFDYVSEHFKTTYWIPGNHEYYYSDIDFRGSSFMENIRDNVFLLNNKAVIEGNTKLIFSTLWSKISKENSAFVKRRLNDFYLINYKGKPLTVEHYNLMHKQSLAFLETELQNKENYKTFVVTHHLPTYKNYPEKYQGKILNEAFTVELRDFMTKHQPDYWLYGHIHFNTPNFKIGKTELTTNQLGYVFHNENFNFSTNKYISF